MSAKIENMTDEQEKQYIRDFTERLADLLAGAVRKEVVVSEIVSTIKAEMRNAIREASKEICICAAIRTKKGKVFRGHRHSDCYYAMVQRGINEPNAEQGFVTSRNRFVSREEGRKLQGAAGIKSVSKEGYMPGTLFSEDLY